MHSRSLLKALDIKIQTCYQRGCSNELIASTRNTTCVKLTHVFFQNNYVKMNLTVRFDSFFRSENFYNLQSTVNKGGATNKRGNLLLRKAMFIQLSKLSCLYNKRPFRCFKLFDCSVIEMMTNNCKIILFDNKEKRVNRVFLLE